MVMLSRLSKSGFQSLVALVDKPRPDPSLVYNERPVTGLFAGLTAEQKARALKYRGDENHGDHDFKRSPRS